MGAIGSVARIVHVLILSVWFGAGVLFLSVLAPNAFDLLPSRDLAGSLVTATLQKIDLFGLLAGPVLLATLLLGWMQLGVPLRARAILALVMTLAAGISGRLLTPEMVRLRQAMGRRIEDVAASDPYKIDFTRLHGVSTALLVMHLLFAFLLLVAAMSASAPKKKFGIEL